jgi:hypothetical protein
MAYSTFQKVLTQQVIDAPPEPVPSDSVRELGAFPKDEEEGSRQVAQLIRDGVLALDEHDSLVPSASLLRIANP